jgi:hypothetical protein
MAWRELWTSASGVKHFWVDDDVDGEEYKIVSTFDTTPILEQNKAMYSHNDGYSPTRDLQRVASIPLILWMKWLNEEGWDAFDPACEHKLNQKLNSSEYLFLRTAPGRL